MKLPEMKDEDFLRLAREEDNCNISAGSIRGVFRKRGHLAAEASVPVRKVRFRRARRSPTQKARVDR